MGPWLALLVLVAGVAGDARLRRQVHHLGGGPQQFAPSPRPPTQPLLTRPAGPQLAFQFLPQQAYRQEAHTASPVSLLTVRPTPPLQTPTPRTRASPAQHSAFLPTPRPALQQAPAPRRLPVQQGPRGRPSVTREELADELPLEEEEEEKPDRLTELLPLSKFNCGGLGTGYYADEGLQCEVFHYCQGGSRHSWICPEGFTFHQVHLICMPPGGDNICQKSSQFHFVNDYLYRPINAEEVQAKPNVTLRYADRYYPENYERDEEDGQQPLVFASPQRLPAPQQKRPHQALRSQQPLVQLVRPQQQQYQSRNNNQVFHSPEEVNIPLQHRRPVVQQRARDSYGDDDDYEGQRPTYG
ncbi:uncharacterized protein [Hetaerina americana]|uniref:uncharacterized protein n=1 Tax=Hetaerina americana TaxID=62018 RepID=UPI003A7F19DE